MSYLEAQVPSAVVQETGSGSCQLWGWNLAQHHCHHILLVRAVVGFPHIPWEGTETSLLHGKNVKNFVAVFNLPCVLFSLKLTSVLYFALVSLSLSSPTLFTYITYYLHTLPHLTSRQPYGVITPI